MGPLGRESVQKGVQWSLRRARGTVFLPLKGSWERALLFWFEAFVSIDLFQLFLSRMISIDMNVLSMTSSTSIRRGFSADACRRISAVPGHQKYQRSLRFLVLARPLVPARVYFFDAYLWHIGVCSRLW